MILTAALQNHEGRALALVAYLALGRQPQNQEVIASLLWPDLDDKHALSALRSTFYALIAPVSNDWGPPSV
jgi:DNA-binding SARP family transcriptional activator